MCVRARSSPGATAEAPPSGAAVTIFEQLRLAGEKAIIIDYFAFDELVIKAIAAERRDPRGRPDRRRRRRIASFCRGRASVRPSHPMDSRKTALFQSREIEERIRKRPCTEKESH
jgi:hypothetical protein